MSNYEEPSDSVREGRVRPVDIVDIKEAPPEVPPSNNKNSNEELEALAHEQETFKSELGWLGRPLGGRKEKPGNISGLVIVLCFIMIFVSYFRPPNEAEGMIGFEQIFSGLLSIVTLILGYLFGSNDSKT